MPPDPARPAPTDAIDRAYEHHRGMVRRALAQLGVEPSALDDATQDVFVVLVRRIADFDRTRSWTNWLWGIAKGVAAGYRRSRARRGRLQAALLEPIAPATPDDALARRRAAETLEAFLATLDADRCAVFVLSEIEGCSGPEIAARLGVNLNTAYARLRVARERFDQALGRNRPKVASWWLFPQRTAIGHVAASLLIAPIVAPVDHAVDRAPAVAAQTIDPSRPSIAPSAAPRIADAPMSAAPEEDVIIVDEAPNPRRAPKRSRSAPPESQPQPVEISHDGPLVEFVAPPRGATSPRPRIHVPPLVRVRENFLDRLHRLERDL